MSTPIIRTYKVAQSDNTATTATAPTAEPATVAPVNSITTTPETATGSATTTTTTVTKTESSTATPTATTDIIPPQSGGESIVAPAPVPATTAPVSGENVTIAPDSTATKPMPVSDGGTVVAPAPATTSSGGGDNKPQPIKNGEQFISEDDDGMEMEFVDPKEVKNALKELKNIQSELKRFLKQVKKLPNSTDDAATINELLSQAVGYYKNISAPAEDMSLREALQEYWDARLWDEVNVIRAKVELPKELASVAKDLKKAKKLITQKPFLNLGLDISVVSGALTEVETAYNEAKTNYDQGNMEDAQMAMEPIHGGLHPGEIMGVLYQMKEIKGRMKGLKNKEVKAIVDELLVDVVDSANAGEFREANQAMNEIKSELMKIMQKYMKSTVKMDDKTKAKFDKLEEMMEKKLGGEKKIDPKEEVME